MFYLKQSDFEGGEYKIVNYRSKLTELKSIADKSCLIDKKRWVIVDDNHNLICYCDDIKNEVEEFEQKLTNEGNLYIVNDYYVKMVLRSKNIKNYISHSRPVRKNTILFGKKDKSEKPRYSYFSNGIDF